VSDHVTLTLRAPLEESIEADCIAPNAFGSLGEGEIGALPVWAGRTRRTLADYFDVKGGRSTSIRVVGDVRRMHDIAAGMSDGDLVVDGDVGSRLATGMIAGEVDILGSAGDDAGVGMSGGSLRIRGNAGDRVGAAMPGASRGLTGGEIVVEGSAGADAGARMRRGLLFVGGDAGTHAARAIIAGTVIVLGRVGRDPAFASKRGSLVVGGGVDVPITYRFACDYEPPHVRLALTYLVRRYGLSLGRELVHGRYRRYCGDAGTVGKGEILEWIRE
jgi:formylmethanofuran dehydrogenase subunit C